MLARSGGRGGVSRAVLMPIVASLTAAALLTGVSLVAVRESDQAITHDALRRVESNRDAAVRAVQRQSADLKRTIATFASDPTLAAGLIDPAALPRAEQQMTLLARSKGAPGVVLSDLRGRTAAVYPSMPERIGQDFSYRDWFQGAKRTGKPYVSRGYRSVIVGAPLAVGIATPVTLSGKRVGYLTIVGQLDAVRAVAEHARHDDGVVITVTDQGGQRLTSALPVDDRGEPLTTSIDRGTREALAGRRTSTVSDQDLSASAPVPDVGWTVTATLTKDEALAPAASFRDSLGLSLAASLLLLLLATGIAVRSARRRAAEHTEVEVERARLTTLFAESPIGILECDADGIVVTVNEALSKMLGYSPDELVGTRGTDLLERDKVPAADIDIARVLDGDLDRYTRERLYRAKDGTLVPCLTSVILVRESTRSLGRVVAFIVDQREQKRIEDALRASEDRLKELALHDDLTGLANRRLLLDRCTTAFAAARRGTGYGTTVAALFLDLDGFKPVNDVYGHERGDQVLRDIASDLVAVVRPMDTVARVGGDEFVVLLGAFEGAAHVREIAERITTAVRRDVVEGSTLLRVTASVGLAWIDLSREPDARPDQLVSRADTAMYRAKELGRDRHDIYQLPDVPHARSHTAALP